VALSVMELECRISNACAMHLIILGMVGIRDKPLHCG